jgi:hypothetical protein
MEEGYSVDGSQLDRALSLPKSWIDDQQRCREAYVSGEATFATKPELHDMCWKVTRSSEIF